MAITLIGHILAIGIGLSLDLIGGGGSILAVPILLYVTGGRKVWLLCVNARHICVDQALI